MRKVLVFSLAPLFLLLPFVFPLVSSAETANLRAGFAQGSIWISRSHVVEGDAVNIFAVLYNSSDNSISGDVVFAVDDVSIATKNFTLGAGETQILSAPWIAKAGSHTTSARIEKATGVSENPAALNQTTGTISVSVEDPPPPSPAVQVLNTVTSAIQTGVASTAPAVLSAVHSIYNATEAIRMQAKTALLKQLAGNAGGAGVPQLRPDVADTASASGATTAGANAGTSPVSGALRYMAAAGLAIVSSKTLFYISLALILLLLIQILRVSLRERRHGRFED
ncbi:MAG: hypothetical protein Q7S08_04170 [bacterium]|nr:hypothetical protein [bacterium]